MKITYYAATDTLYLEFCEGDVAETREIDETTLIDLDTHGNICAMTIEQASRRAGAPEVKLDGLSSTTGPKYFRNGMSNFSD